MNLVESIWQYLDNTGLMSFLDAAGDNISSVISSLIELESRINGVTFQDNINISHWVGMVRYFIGDTMYTAVIITLWIGIAFCMYKAIIALWKAINSALTIDLTKFIN